MRCLLSIICLWTQYQEFFIVELNYIDIGTYEHKKNNNKITNHLIFIRIHTILYNMVFFLKNLIKRYYLCMVIIIK